MPVLGTTKEKNHQILLFCHYHTKIRFGSLIYNVKRSYTDIYSNAA